MFVQPRQPLERRFDVLCGNVTHFLSSENSNQPPEKVRESKENRNESFGQRLELGTLNRIV